MPRVNKIIQSLNAGELSPLMDVRIDQNKYQAGCRTMENFYPLIYGGAERRPGTYYAGEVKDSTAKTRLVAFERSVALTFILEFGNQYIRFYKDQGRVVGGLLADTSAWADATDYKIGDFVSYSSTIYRCIVDHTSDAAGPPFEEPDTNTTDWIAASLTSDLYPIYELVSPYLTADLFELKFEHSADVMYITHPDYEPRKLSRTSSTTWELDELAFDDGPFINQNVVDTALITPVAPAWATSTAYKVDDAVASGGSDYRCLVAHTSGTFASDLSAGYWTQDSKGSVRTGTSITLTASGTNADGSAFAPFTTGATAGHAPSGTTPTSKTLTGALFSFLHTRESYKVTRDFTAADQTSENLLVYKGTTWDYVTNGTWTGRMELQRSYDDGTTWETVHTTDSEDNANSQVDGEEIVDDALYRMASYDSASSWSGTASCTLSVRDRTQEGIVEISAVASTTSATATVMKTLGGVSATYMWSEGHWSNKNGWPTCVAISPEERLTFAGSTNYPLTVWCSKSGDYTSMETGVLDDDAIIFTLVGTGKQNIIRWIISKDVLLLGTAGGEHKLGATDENEPMTPTNVKATVQSNYGSADIQALLVNDAIVFVQRGARKIRELIYSFERDSYVADDLTIFSNHITSSTITEIAYQRTPDPMLWCIRDDGQLAVMSYEKAQNVYSWCRLITETAAGESDFESVAVVSTTGEEDEVWVIVERVINSATKRFVEYFSTRSF